MVTPVPPGVRSALPGMALAATILLASSASAQFGGPGAPVNLNIGVTPNVITGTIAGDLNGDGLGDLVGVDNANPGNIGLALGNGTGYTVQPVVPGGATGSPTGLFSPELGDFDIDGNLDLACLGTTATHTAIYVFSGAPTGGAPPGYTFALQTTETIELLPGTATGLRVTDMDGDGQLDLIATNDSPNPVRRIVAERHGTGGFIFGPLHSSTTLTGSSDIDVCVDFNNDGRKDFVIVRPAGPQPGFVDVYAGIGVGLPTSPTVSLQLPSVFSPRDVVWTRCDQNNRYDLAIAAEGPTPGIFLLRNLGAPPFFNQVGFGQVFPSTSVPTTLNRLEANFDGVEDIVSFNLAAGPGSVKQSNFEVFRVIDCAAQSMGAVSSGAINTASVSEVLGAHHSVGEQNAKSGTIDVVVVNHASAGGNVVTVFTNNAQPAFTISPVKPRLSQTSPVTFTIQVPPQFGGLPYYILFSLNGTQPGTPIGPGLVLPLNAPFLPVTIRRTLGATGMDSFSTSPVTFPSAPTFFSLQLACSAAVMNAAGVFPVHVTNPAVITLP